MIPSALMRRWTSRGVKVSIATNDVTTLDPSFCGVFNLATAPLESLEGLAAYCIMQIRTVQTKGPYTIVGYSFGAPISWNRPRAIVDWCRSTGVQSEDEAFAMAYSSSPNRGKRGGKRAPKWSGISWYNTPSSW